MLGAEIALQAAEANGVASAGGFRIFGLSGLGFRVSGSGFRV